MDTWNLIAGERARLHETLTGLEDAQWAVPSWCAGWTTKDTLAHLVSVAETTPPAFVGGMLRSGFSFTRFSHRNIATVGADPVPRLLDRLEAAVPSRRAPPGPVGSWLVETVAHGEDIAQPARVTIRHTEEALVAAADTAAATQPLLGSRKRVAGLRLRAEDVDWTTGDGPEIRGPLHLLLLGMLGRRPALDHLTGDGVPILAERAGR